MAQKYILECAWHTLVHCHWNVTLNAAMCNKSITFCVHTYKRQSVKERRWLLIIDEREGRMYKVSDTAFQAFPILLFICIKIGPIHHTRELVQIGWY